MMMGSTCSVFDSVVCASTAATGVSKMIQSVKKYLNIPSFLSIPSRVTTIVACLCVGLHLLR